MQDRVAGLQGERAREARECVGGTSGTCLEQAEVVVRLGVGRVQLRGAQEELACLATLAAALQRHAESVAGLVVLGHRAHRLAEGGDGLGAAQPQERGRVAAQGSRQARLAAQRLLVRGQRLRVAPRGVECAREIGLNGGVVRLQPGGLAQEDHGPLNLAGGRQRDAQQLQCIDVVRLQGQHLFVERHRFGDAPLAMQRARALERCVAVAHAARQSGY